MLKTKELQEQAREDLQTKLNSLQEELYKLRYQASTGRLDKSHLIGQKRKDIARIKTVLRQKELSQPSTLEKKPEVQTESMINR